MLSTLAVHQAIGGPAPVPGSLLVIVMGYGGILLILVVLGIWGFRLGSRGPSGNQGGGGGPKRPEPAAPPPGGRQLDDEGLFSDLDLIDALELQGLEEQEPDRVQELAAPRAGRS